LGGAFAFCKHYWSVASIQYFSLPQLKILQEVITLIVFAAFAILYMGIKPTLNFMWAGFCLVGAVFFIFQDRA
jgi:uncharacterized protein (DUF486 family)